MNEKVLARVRRYIKDKGPTAVHKQTGISIRALQYISNEQRTPNHLTLAALLAAMESQP